MITSFVLDTLEDTMEINQTLKWFYRLLPAFCLGDGLAQLSFCNEGRECPVFTGTGFGLEISTPLALDVAGLDLIFLACHPPAYLLLTLLIEYAQTFPAVAALFQWRPGWLGGGSSEKTGGAKKEEGEKMDADVVAEVERVRSGVSAREGDVVRLDGLRKVYPSAGGGASKVAVKALSFGIGRGECFGFLGINGAGKTTTLKMLSGDIAISGGEATIEDLNIRTEQVNCRTLHKSPVPEIRRAVRCMALTLMC